MNTNHEPLAPSRTRILSVGLLCALAGVAAGAFMSRSPHSPASPHITPGAVNTPDPLDPVQLERIGVHFTAIHGAGPQLSIDLVGMLELDRTQLAEVSTHAAGRIASIGARVGQRVRVGEVLARVESPSIGEAAANYHVHGAERRSAEQQLQRLRGLRDQGLATQRELELAEAAVRTATANQQADRSRLRAYGVGPEHLDGLAPLLAPIEGEVIRSNVVLGSWLQPESEAFVVANLSTLWAEIDVPESDLGRVEVGDAVGIDVPSTGQRDLAGRVAHIHAEVDAGTRMGRVRVTVPNPDGRLRAGLSLTAHIRPDEHGTLHIPSQSVRACEGSEACVLIREGNRVRWRPIVAGARTGAGVEVRSGISEGDEIAVSGLGLLGGS